MSTRGIARSRIVDSREVAATTRDAMFALLSCCFEDHPRHVFEADLAGKDRVILLERDGELVGFSTVRVDRERLQGREVGVLFSGDTVVHPAHWGSPEMQRGWLTTALAARDDLGLPLYWLLICSGYRTYRYLPVFFREFWPRHDQPTPPAIQGLVDSLAVRRFGARYRDGVVRLPGGRLREGVSPIESRRLRDRHVAFFDRVNPGHHRGDELVCLTEVAPENFTRAGAKVLQWVAA